MRFLLVLLAACASAPPAAAPVPVPEPVPVPLPAPVPGPAPDPDRAGAGTGARARHAEELPRAGTRSGTEEEIAFCIEETNRYRRAARHPAFARSKLLDDFAREGAKHDARVKRAHDHFNSAQFPGSFSALAENELPWWHLADDSSVRKVIRAGLAAMWAEGPGGGHYENLVGKFTEMGCGIHIDGDAITVVQDFRTP